MQPRRLSAADRPQWAGSVLPTGEPPRPIFEPTPTFRSGSRLWYTRCVESRRRQTLTEEGYGNHRVDRARIDRGRDREGDHAGSRPGWDRRHDVDRYRRSVSRWFPRKHDHGPRAERLFTVEHCARRRWIAGAALDLSRDYAHTHHDEPLAGPLDQNARR